MIYINLNKLCYELIFLFLVAFETDILYLPKTRGARHQYAVILVDIYSRFVFLRPLRTKSADSVKDALEDIIKTNKLTKITSINSDRGNEYVANASYFKEKYGIVWFWLKGRNKAAIAERAIRTVKGVLYRYMRLHPKKTWNDFYQEVIDQINSRPHKSLNGFAPADFANKFSDILSRKVLTTSTPASVKKQRRVKKKPLFKINDLVFTELPLLDTERGFDIQRGVINKVVGVDTEAYPYLYDLEDLEGRKLSQRFYSIQLKKAPSLRNIPKQIKHIYASRRKNYKREYQVNFVGSKYVFFISIIGLF